MAQRPQYDITGGILGGIRKGAQILDMGKNPWQPKSNKRPTHENLGGRKLQVSKAKI